MKLRGGSRAMRSRTHVIRVIVGVLALVSAATPQARAQDGRPQAPRSGSSRIENIGGLPTTVLGHPHVIDTPLDKAIEFNGIDDALLIGEHPLAGAEARVAPRTAMVSSLRAGSCNRTGHRWSLVIRTAPQCR
jgi:hypothetical protein